MLQDHVHVTGSTRNYAYLPWGTWNWPQSPTRFKLYERGVCLKDLGLLESMISSRSVNYPGVHRLIAAFASDALDTHYPPPPSSHTTQHSFLNIRSSDSELILMINETVSVAHKDIWFITWWTSCTVKQTTDSRCSGQKAQDRKRFRCDCLWEIYCIEKASTLQRTVVPDLKRLFCTTEWHAIVQKSFIVTRA